jgi:2-oxoglutarate ferredoxin oxidoreductase subunit gamma
MMQENNKTMRILIAGFGGQGVLFLGKLIAYAGVLKGKQVTWLPSYGPEMRGGTANCAVILSDGPIGSPIVSEPDVLIAMNLPSFSAYEQKVRPGGTIVLDASLIPDARARTDVSYRALPATRLAADEHLEGLSNMILLGAFLEDCLLLSEEETQQALAQTVPSHKKHLIEANLRAIAIGKARFECAQSDTRPTQAEHRPRRAG